MMFGYESDIPERNVLIGYLGYLTIGFLCLMLPISHNADTAWLDDLFTAVSAISTTGLATVDIATTYSTFGQCIILALVQIGGIGYMTLSSYLLYRVTHHFNSATGKVMNVSMSVPFGMNLKDLVYNTIHFTLFIELIGFIAFYITLAYLNTPVPAWNALFLSISSFCTAGFSPFNNSLCDFSDNLGINITVALLSYAGAMGFIVITDISYKLRNSNYTLTFTSKVILLITFIITVGGTFTLMFSPTDAISQNWTHRVLLSFFQTMSAMTTVGFNTIDLSTIGVGAILVFSFIMFIGASPSGTGGGVKCTTVSATWGFVLSKLGLRKNVTFLGRSIPFYRVESALLSIIVYGTMIFIGCIILSYSEPFSLSKILFEATSAIGTVGLSTGITSELSTIGKFVIIALMYIGRVGVLTFGTALLAHTKKLHEQSVSETDLAT